MLPFLKAPADAPLMTDKHEIDARYRYWRRHILLTIWLGYALSESACRCAIND